jgi:hypothetical protein
MGLSAEELRMSGAAERLRSFQVVYLERRTPALAGRRQRASRVNGLRVDKYPTLKTQVISHVNFVFCMLRFSVALIVLMSLSINENNFSLRPSAYTENIMLFCYQQN